MSDTPAAVASAAFAAGGLAVSELLADYRRRAGELTPQELAHATLLLRKQRTAASTARVAKKTAAKKAAGASADELFADLDNFASGESK